MGAIDTPGAPGRIYTAYGLTFAVPFPCRGLAAISTGADADVVVREGAVPRALEAPVVSDQRWEGASSAPCSSLAAATTWATVAVG